MKAVKMTNNPALSNYLTLNNIFPDHIEGVSSLSDLSKEEKIRMLEQFPKYISSGLRSQSNNIKNLSTSERQDLCIAAAIAFFQKMAGNECFASPESLNKKYNEYAPLFHVKTATVDHMRRIQKRVIENGLCGRRFDNDEHTNITERKLWVNVEAMVDTVSTALSSAFNQATHSALSTFNRFCQLGRQELERLAKAASDKACDEFDGEENDRIRSKNVSKDTRDNKKYKGLPPFEFYAYFFKEDASRAQELQFKANEAKKYDDDFKHFYFNRSQAIELMTLHKTHGVAIAEGFMKFLKSTIRRGDNAIKRLKENAAKAQERKDIINAHRDWVSLNNIDEISAYNQLVAELTSKGFTTQDIKKPKAVVSTFERVKTELEKRIEWIKNMGSVTQQKAVCAQYGLDFDEIVGLSPF